MRQDDLPLLVPDLRLRVVLVTGGAGFLGVNLIPRLIQCGYRVRVLDDLSSPGAEGNLDWLAAKFGERIDFRRADVGDREAVESAVSGVGHVFHLAGPTAVGIDPRRELQTRVIGTLNVLDAIRSQDGFATLVSASSTTVYGPLEDVVLSRRPRRYEPVASDLSRHGIGELRGLDLRGSRALACGSADQYVLDAARRGGLRATVLRLGCVYGPHQSSATGTGWVTRLLLAALTGEKAQLFGEPLQVRDFLFVEDLVDAMMMAMVQLPKLAGHAFNVGGGIENAMSLGELVERASYLVGVVPEVLFETPSSDVPRFFVSDSRRFQRLTGWRRHVPIEDGLRLQCDWLKEHRLGYDVAAPEDRAII